MSIEKQHTRLSQYTLVIAGQFPPPMNGFAYITQEITKSLVFNHMTTIIDIAPHVKKNGAVYHLRRLLLTLKGIWPLFRGSLTTNRRFYIACEGGLGLIYTIMLCAAARVFGFPIYIHHHSFAYIEESKVLMTCLLRVLGKRTTHIVLCPAMAQRLSNRYQRAIRSIVLSNSAFVQKDITNPRIRLEGQPLVIGLLSNLNDEKGLEIFLDILRKTEFARLNIVGILAGPPVSASDRDKIAAAEQELGHKLDYRGPVYGTDKAAFFKSIDVFVFPTHYVNEAQPTVIFEAMAYGIPVLSYDRGCIKGQVGSCGAVLEKEIDFIPFAINWLKLQMTFPRTLEKLKLNAKAAFLDDNTHAKQATETLFDLNPIIVQPSLD